MQTTTRREYRRNDKMKTELDEDLKSQVYAFAKSGGQADGYAKTTKAIGEYVGKLYGHEMSVMVLQLTETNIAAPVLADKADRSQELIWGKEYDLYLKKKDRYDTEKAKVFALILGQCDLPVKNRVESLANFETVVEDRDVVTLLKMIKEAVFGSNDKKYPPRQAAKAWMQLMGVKQQPEESLVAYYKRFISLVERVELTYGSIAPRAVAEKDPKYKTGKTADDLTVAAREKMLASVFMDGANSGFKPLLRDLENDYALGAALYPATMNEALQVMTVYTDQPLYKNIVKKGARKRDDELTQVSFAQMSIQEKRKKNLCFRCGKKGHKANECTSIEVPAVQNMQWTELNGNTNLATIAGDIERSRNGWQM